MSETENKNVRTVWTNSRVNSSYAYTTTVETLKGRKTTNFSCKRTDVYFVKVSILLIVRQHCCVCKIKSTRNKRKQWQLLRAEDSIKTKDSFIEICFAVKSSKLSIKNDFLILTMQKRFLEMNKTYTQRTSELLNVLAKRPANSGFYKSSLALS